MFKEAYDYLPESLQETSMWYVLGVCWATGYFARSLRNKFATPDVLQWLILCTGIEFSLFIIHPIPRAIGMGLIYSVLSMVSYDLVLTQIESKIKAIVMAVTGKTPPTP